MKLPDAQPFVWRKVFSLSRRREVPLLKASANVDHRVAITLAWRSDRRHVPASFFQTFVKRRLIV